VQAESPRKINVLAVDDKPANLLAIEAVLGSACEVLRARSGAEAIALVEFRRDIDIILMDVQMPGMDGFETAARIKQIESARDLPIVFITAIYKEDPYVKKGYEVGGIDYFYKPFDPEILRLKVGVYATFKQRADILRERERQLRFSEQLLSTGRRLSSMLEALPLGVIIADRKGRLCQVNEAVSRILHTLEPMASGSYGEVLGWWDASGRIIRDPRGPLSRAVHGGELTHNELTPIRCADGTEKAILCSASPLRQLSGEIVGAVVVIQDVTEPRKIEADLQRLTRLISLGVELEHGEP
jgi:CheY-like chemotaxis protein